MPRIFLSHSRLDNRLAIALRQWLIEQNPPLADEIYLDTDPDTGIRGGVRWKDALRQASSRCEAVICLLSPNWEASPECKTEYRFAEYLNKRIFSVLIAPLVEDDPTREWQQIDLRSGGSTTAIDIGDGAGPVVFPSEGLYRLRQGIIGSGIAAESFAWPPPNHSDRAPYRGWEPLDGVDAAIFFGRNAEILRGLDALRGMRRSGVENLFVVLGPSGTGKSSFLRAGLLPRVSRDDRDFVVLDIVRPQRNALTGDTGFARAIHATRTRLGLNGPSLGVIKEACDSADVASLHEWLLDIQRTASARLLIEADEPPLPTLVLPVDQGEELFGADAGYGGPKFLELISALVADRDAQGLHAGLIVAVTIRTDRYTSLQTSSQLTGVQSVVFDELKPMPRTQFKEVVTGPAERATQGGRPLQLEDSLVNRLLDECTEGADTLPLLALTLSRLYEDYASFSPGSDTATLTLAHYEAMGGMQSVVRTEIDKLLSAEPAQRAHEIRSLRAAFIPWLATFNPENDHPVRRLAQWNDLPVESRPLIERFVASRLLVRDDREGQVTVEVALESLLRQWDDLAAWLAEERENLKTADALEGAARAWENNRRDGAWLLQGTRLVEAEMLAAKPVFSGRLSAIRGFLDESRERESERIEAGRSQREARLRAVEQLAAAESVAREQAQAHATVLRKRSRVLRIVLAMTLVVAIAAVVGLVKATRAEHDANDARAQADRSAVEAVAARLSAEGQAMLGGLNPGGDARALQEILAAPSISTSVDEGALLTALTARANTLKIIDQRAEVLSAAFSSDGRRIVSGSADNTVGVWNTETGQPLMEPLTGHTGRVTSVAFDRDGHRIVSGSDDHTVRVWNADSGELIEILQGHKNVVRSVAFSPDGRKIASGGEDDTVRVWDADTGQPIGVPLALHTGAVWSVAFSPDGRRIVSASADNTMRLWDSDTRLPIGDPMSGHTGAVRSAVFSPDGRRIVSAGADRTVRLWDATTRRPVAAPFTGHTDVVRFASFSPDGHHIVSASRDKTVRIWNADTGEPVADLTGHTQPVSSAVFSADGRQIVSASDDGTVHLWSADADDTIGQILPGHEKVVRSVAFSQDGHRIVSAGDDGTIRTWDADSGQPVGTFPTDRTDAVNAVAFSPDGHRIVSGGDDETVRVWDADTGAPVGDPLTDHADVIYAVAFSPDGHRIVAGGRDHKIRVWNADTGDLVGGPITAHDSVVRSLSFSSDGRRIVSGSDDHTVRLWDADTLRPIGSPHSHTDVVRSAAYSPDGQRVVSGGFDKKLRLWDGNTGESEGDFSDTDRTFSVTFAMGGQRILSGGTARTLQLWNASTGQPVGPPLLGHRGEVISVAMSTDGRRMVSGGDDGTVRSWPGPALWRALVCDKLSANTSHQHWKEWVGSNVDYKEACPGLPIAPDD
jgi:WD40 repeat protein